MVNQVIKMTLEIKLSVVNRSHNYYYYYYEWHKKIKWHDIDDDDHLNVKLRFLLSNQFDSSWACNTHTHTHSPLTSHLYFCWIENVWSAFLYSIDLSIISLRFITFINMNNKIHVCIAMSHHTHSDRSFTQTNKHTHTHPSMSTIKPEKDLGNFIINFYSTCKRRFATY